MHKFHRLRKSKMILDLLRENQYTVNDLVYPLFITPGQNEKEPIDAMPGQFRFSIDTVLEEIAEAHTLGIKAFLIFGVNNPKSPNAKYA